MKRKVIYGLAGVGLLAVGSVGVVLGQGTAVDPIPGSVWTYLGATFGAAWVMPAPSSLAWIPSNAALAILATAAPQAYRAGFYAPGDGGKAIYVKTVAPCSLNGGVGDNGWQVKSIEGGCWLLDPSAGGTDVRVWGARNDIGPSFDSAPMIRAASYYSEFSGTTISVPRGNFYLNTADPDEGTGAIVLGKKVPIAPPTPGNPHGTKYHVNFTGQTWTNHPDDCFTHNPAFLLGPGVNRPLIFAKLYSGSSRFEKMCLSGLKDNQTGYAGGPGGKLYTLVSETQTDVTPESSFILSEVTVRDGYNGNIYHGGARGIFYAYNIFSMYSGQTVTDPGIRLEGFDSFIYNLQQGRSTGYGVIVGANSNTTITAGASFYNGRGGLYVFGRATLDLQVTNFRLQHNDCMGLEIANAPPSPGRDGGGHTYTGLIFEGNSAIGNGVCSDIIHDGNSLYKDTFVGTVFGGHSITGAPLVKHNVEIGPAGGVRLLMNGTIFADQPNSVSFTNDFESVIGDYQFTPTWVPTFKGGGDAGTGTVEAGFPIGHWNRYGKRVTVSGVTKLSAFSGATGGAIIDGIPLLSAPGQFATCSISNVMGWTGPAGYTHLSGSIGAGDSFITITREGSGQPVAFSAVTEWAAIPAAPPLPAVPIQISFNCSYATQE